MEGRIEKFMRPHLLFCYTECPNCLKIVDYLKSIFRDCSLEITFYHLIEVPPSLLMPRSDYYREIEREELLEKFIEERKEKTLERFEKISKDLGQFVDLTAHYVIEVIEGNKAEHVLNFLKERKFTGVVMGKRGLGTLATIWAGSFTQKMILYSQQPLWIVRKGTAERKFLIAVDTGEAGLKVASYALDVLSKLGNFEAIFFHAEWPLISKNIERPLTDLKREELSSPIYELFSEIKERVKTIGIPINNIRIKVRGALFGASSAILKEVRSNNFSTVIAGKRGKGGFTGLLLGSVATKLVSTLEKEALWLVP